MVSRFSLPGFLTAFASRLKSPVHGQLSKLSFTKRMEAARNILNSRRRVRPAYDHPANRLAYVGTGGSSSQRHDLQPKSYHERGAVKKKRIKDERRKTHNASMRAHMAPNDHNKPWRQMYNRALQRAMQ